MPIDVTFGARDNLFTFRYDGNVTAEDWAASLALVAADPAWPTSLRLLVDRRGSEDVATHGFLLAVRRHVLAHLPALADARCAIVVARPVDYGMARVAQVHFDELPLRLAVFYSTTEAIAWLASTR